MCWKPRAFLRRELARKAERRETDRGGVGRMRDNENEYHCREE